MIMPVRKIPLVNDKIYHVYSRSIAKFKIFNSSKDYERMVDAISFYSQEDPPCKFSFFQKMKEKYQSFNSSNTISTNKTVEIIAYCIMPTHIHLVLKQLRKNGISKFIGQVLISYSKYFNTKSKRKGYLWEGRFQNISVENDSQFMHLTRYIHLNPVTNHLVDRAEDWKFSSYGEFMGKVLNENKLCDFKKYLSVGSDTYRKFTNDRISYQRELASIKHLVLE